MKNQPAQRTRFAGRLRQKQRLLIAATVLVTGVVLIILFYYQSRPELSRAEGQNIKTGKVRVNEGFSITNEKIGEDNLSQNILSTDTTTILRTTAELPAVKKTEEQKESLEDQFRLSETVISNNYPVQEALAPIDSDIAETGKGPYAHILRFNVRENNGNPVLSWATDEEKDCVWFVVERSLNNKLFNVLEKIPGAGQSSGIQTYSVTDNASATSPLTYYRIKAINAEGQAKILLNKTVQTQKLKNFGIKDVQIVPGNPGSNARINFESSVNASLPVRLYDEQGTTIYNRQIQVRNGYNSLVLHDTDVLASGTYIISIGEGSVVARNTFVK